MKYNVGQADRFVRFLIGIVLIWLYFTHRIIGTWAILLLVFGLVMLVTSVFHFCPIYAIFGFSTYRPDADFKDLVAQDALIVDVRQISEFNNGHIKGSINIPLDQLSSHIDELKNYTIITCCASGTRSVIAKKILRSKNLKAYNGGSWKVLQQAIS